MSFELEEFLRVTSCAFFVQGYGKATLLSVFARNKQTICKCRFWFTSIKALHIFLLLYPGLTETCGLSTIGFPDEMSLAGTVGVPSVFSEVRLKEVPEMGYNPLGNPPCGEVCVRGRTVFSGYHKNPELTKEAFRDGWFHTG